MLFVFRFDVWPGLDANPGFSSNKPKHYLLDHGDVQMSYTNRIWRSVIDMHRVPIYWFERVLTPNKPTHYLLDYGDFKGNMQRSESLA